MRKGTCKRRGFLLLWANIAVLMILVFAGAAAAMLAQAAARGRAAKAAADRVFLAQEVIETMKYNERFRAEIPLPGASGGLGETYTVVRNGKTYTVTAGTNRRETEGIPMKALTCTVAGEDGETLTLWTLSGRWDE